ncbi:MAG: exodeoxyribonuclease VII large subunit [Akkermansiaceae bacterium]|nr:exodeoxyribonuclease VII large subunit [Akkermansiaceae bacterium]
MMMAIQSRSGTVLSVSELTRSIRDTLEGRFGTVWVEGEISNYRPHGSGHHYFTLKDDTAQLSCVLFRGQARNLSMRLADGLKVQAEGEITVYEARGQYQLVAKWLQPVGRGELQARFEALKRKLEVEGLFDRGAKKPVPRFPRCVGVVTSPTGAAIRDILNVLSRRAPWVRVLVFPVRVQGEGGEREIAETLNWIGSLRTGDLPPIDTLIVGRGGGSIEDLWNFNEEIVARAIHACPIPVISAVGHEIDFTIADFVADLRAPTPSAAAELAVPDGEELVRRLGSLSDRLNAEVEDALEHFAMVMELTEKALLAHEPRRLLQGYAQSIDHAQERLGQWVESAMVEFSGRLDLLGSRLGSQRPIDRIESERNAAGRLWERLDFAGKIGMDKTGDTLAGLAKALEMLSPSNVMGRGYSMTFDRDGNAVIDPARVEAGDILTTRVAKGEIESVVRG